MKIKPECATCIIRQVVDAAREITNNEKEQFKLVKDCLGIIMEVYGEDAVPAWMGTNVHRYLKKISGNDDPYKRLKEIANKIALNYLEKIKDYVEVDDDLERLRRKIKVAIAGNVIDFGPYSTDIDIISKIKETVEGDLKVDYSEELLKDLKSSKKVFYVCDNAGEIVFDRVLIEEIKKYVDEVVVAVKGKPILNDATLEDAKLVGIDKIAKVITTGSDIIGIILEECSEEFLKEFESSDLVIAKGMGNYESLTEYEDRINKPLYYILKAKCVPVAGNIGVKVGDNVLLRKRGC
ncbi:damage-control phosphatase ARMT1 family protein [Methanotorris formicicus]|uniref:Damage-control phosphatase ARMT1-like metal-binding domain-containing protein n=1 Tax=Methanotorris formicicus Mc-S-70 TaxID=647171 RepID=H1KWW5_9EURY|nr:DUF89 domain-containing protein [Methanotorris formicicus]EHP89098.1 protein of unknown function DUF89 [Methanotorris formicicus Mc-S-70]